MGVSVPWALKSASWSTIAVMPLLLLLADLNAAELWTAQVLVVCKMTVEKTDAGNQKDKATNMIGWNTIRGHQTLLYRQKLIIYIYPMLTFYLHLGLQAIFCYVTS